MKVSYSRSKLMTCAVPNSINFRSFAFDLVDLSLAYFSFLRFLLASLIGGHGVRHGVRRLGR
jgi:hypothetical protein